MEFMTLMDLLEEIGVKRDKVRYWSDKGVIPAPVKYIGRSGYYPEDAEKVRKFFSGRESWQRI